jgi:undecaprenyl diphosphate synthase
VQVPAHVAIIMDGNGRWARQRRKPRHAGHRAGVGVTRAVIEACAGRGVSCLTLFAFSSENWNRPRTEISRLMDLFMDALDRQVKDLHENGIRLCFIGEREKFPRSLQQGMARSESLTAENQRMRVNIAVGYGGRWELVEAARALAASVKGGEIEPTDIDEAALAGQLQLASQLPDPDLFIRTGGERRLSNFLLWHLAYTELYFTDTLWPDFDDAELEAAINWYATRERRFGTVQDA